MDAFVRDTALNRARGTFRMAFVAIALISWAVLVFMMWREFHTLPTAAELADDRHVRPPLPFDLYKHLLASAAELLLIIVLLWPAWKKRYMLRCALLAAVLAIWFFATVPMDLNQMEWLHRRWLAGMVVLAGTAFMAAPFISRRSTREAES